MTIEEKKRVINDHPVFQGLDDATITFVAEHVQFKTYSPNILIIRQGDNPGNVYFNYTGLLKVYFTNESGKYIPVKISEEKDFVGDLGAVDGMPIAATAETIRETCVFILSKNDFIYALQNFPKFALNLLQVWAKKVRVINKQREISFSLELSDRTFIALQTLANHLPNKVITLTHEEIALIVGATRARVTEALHELAEQKKLASPTTK